MACQDCGMATRDPAEFHPHLFCVLKKAGYLDPWAELKRVQQQLYGDDPLPARPPLIRDLPLHRTAR